MSQIQIIVPISGSRYVVRYYPNNNYINYYAIGFLVNNNPDPAQLLLSVADIVNNMMIDAANGVPYYDHS